MTRRRSQAQALTEVQTEYMCAFEAHLAKHGEPPTIREVQHALGISSSSIVATQLNRLVCAGHLTHKPMHGYNTQRAVDAVKAAYRRGAR